jgi:predicted DNA-binding protein (UPF0251 family)
MDVDAPGGLLRAFAALEDPRTDRTKKHSLGDILTIAICAVICGADGWVQVAHFGRCKKKWFQRFLDLPNGIPSHDTFGRVFAMLDPQAFEECFLRWIAQLATASSGRRVAIDGKTLRRSLDAAHGKAAKAQTKHKAGIKTKRLCCGWNHDYLFRVLTQDDQGL